MMISNLIPSVLLASALMLSLGCSNHNPVYSDPHGGFTVEITGDWHEYTDYMADALLTGFDHEYVFSVGAINEKTEAAFFVKTWRSPLCERCKYFTGELRDAQLLLDWANDWLWDAQNVAQDVVGHGDVVLVEDERGLFVEVETTHDTTKSIRRFYDTQSFGVMIEAACGVKKSEWRASKCTDILDTLVVTK